MWIASGIVTLGCIQFVRCSGPPDPILTRSASEGRQHPSLALQPDAQGGNPRTNREPVTPTRKRVVLACASG
jgi:hypothetical protein